jgi:hypothetical protein
VTSYLMLVCRTVSIRRSPPLISGKPKPLVLFNLFVNLLQASRTTQFGYLLNYVILPLNYHHLAVGSLLIQVLFFQAEVAKYAAQRAIRDLSGRVSWHGGSPSLLGPPPDFVTASLTDKF